MHLVARMIIFILATSEVVEWPNGGLGRAKNSRMDRLEDALQKTIQART